MPQTSVRRRGYAIKGAARVPRERGAEVPEQAGNLLPKVNGQGHTGVTFGIKGTDATAAGIACPLMGGQQRDEGCNFQKKRWI